MKSQRLKILSIAFFLVFIVVITRLFYWQIIKNSELKEKVLLQTYKLEKTLPERGKIFTSDNYPIALNQTYFQLSIYKPNLKENLTDVINKIEAVKNGFKNDNSSTITTLETNSNIKWVTFTSQFTQEEKQKLDLAGLEFEKTNNRYYPEGQLAKNIVGFMGKNIQGSIIGYGGLEAFYDKQLKGKTGFIWTSKDGTGQTILTRKSWILEAMDGRNLHTSLNRAIQYHVEKQLEQGIEKFSADSGSAIVMDTKTGSILAMASLSATSSATPSAVKNSSISDLFEPGSIFKPLVVAMALDKKSIPTDFVCSQCDRPRIIGEFEINNWDKQTHPNSTLKDIITNSDNIGMSHIMTRLGLKSFQDYFHLLGLTQKTGIDLQGESKPTIKDYWPDIDLATASFGQGFAVTQIQMIQAFNTIANNGYLVKPHLVEYFDENNKIIRTKTSSETKVFEQKTIENLKEILKYAVENGAISSLKPKDMEVCAKSGTAQVAIKGEYTDSSTIGSYIGFSPCNNPDFTMIVTINNPKTSAWGSSTAAPIWFNLASIIPHLL